MILYKETWTESPRLEAWDAWPRAYPEQMCITAGDGSLLLDAPRLDRTLDHPAAIMQRFWERHFRRVQQIQ